MKITKKEIDKAKETLKEYKKSKANLEQRIVDEEQFWKRRHWDSLKKPEEKTKPSSAWMFNAIVNKHADAMDSYPEAICLPREQSDEESAKILTEILPVVLERNNFKDTYADNWWYKLIHGTACYGVFWDNSLEHGLGDVSIKKLDLLNVFWEPGIRDLQKSRNLFICDMVPMEVMEERYPKLDFVGGNEEEIKDYIHDDTVDKSDKLLVVDWYYKRNGVLHFCKFCEDKILFASENEKGYENGWYEDGEYPIEFDVVYPEEGTVYGFGFVSVCKEPQLYIDLLDEKVMNYISAAANPRFFGKETAGINEKEFLDTSKPIVHVANDVDERVLRQITLQPLNSYVMNFRESKIDELKETSSNRDFSQGSTQGGVTSGAAISVLQEAGNKTSRDIIDSSYRVFSRLIRKVIERMRQFYEHERVFRVIGETGANEFVRFNNEALQEQSMGIVGASKTELFRKPIFDIDVKAQKQNPYSTLSQNETAMNLYTAGMFNPQMAQAAIPALKMMTFEGKKEVEDYVAEGMTLYNQLQQMQAELEMLKKQNARLQGIEYEPTAAAS